jgi:radical SAM superfamily enzyme YgiQ (UPF0313 family)
MISGERIAGEIKRRFPGIKIIWGGNHATFAADQLAAKDYVDVVVLGEGMVTFKELVERIDAGKPIDDVRGIVFRENGKTTGTGPRKPIEDINTLPFPDWTMVSKKMPGSTAICSSRGCPFDCIYCSTTSFWGRKWRARSAGNIIEEIEHFFEVYRPEKKSLKLAFVDDNFTVDRQRVKRFCRLIPEKNWDLNWGVSSRIEFLDEELVGIMSDAGCSGIFLGIESGSDRVLERMKRRYTADQVKAAVEICLNAGILPTCSFMIGNPFEDRNDIEKTLSLLMALKSHHVQVHIFSPVIGTEVCKNAEKYGVEILTDQYELINPEGKAFLNTKYLKAKEIEDIYHKALGLILRKNREGKHLEKAAEINRNRRANARKADRQNPGKGL